MKASSYTWTGIFFAKGHFVTIFFFWKKGFLYFLCALNYFMYHIVLVYEIVCRIYENALHFYGYLLNMIVYFYVLCYVCFGVLTNIVRHSYEFNGRHEMWITFFKVACIADLKKYYCTINIFHSYNNNFELFLFFLLEFKVFFLIKQRT